MTTPSGSRSSPSPGLSAGALALVLAGLVFELHHRFEERVAPLYGDLLQAADRAGLSTSPLARATGEMGTALWAAGIAFALVVLAAVVFAWRAGRRRFTRRASVLAVLALGWLAWDTFGFGGGLSLPLQLLQVVVPAAALIVLRQRPLVAALVAAGFWVGLGFLTGGGFAIALTDEDLRRVDHAQYAGQWTVLLIAWSWDHLKRTDGERDDLSRWTGFASLGALGLVTVSGYASMVLPGEALVSVPGVHLALAALAVLATAAHVVVCVRASRRRKQPKPGALWWRAGLLVALLLGAVGLHPGAEEAEAVVVASTARIEPAWLGASETTVGCGASTGCHVMQAAAHARGAHAQAASALYRSVVAELVAEGGDAAVCARCHEPFAALTGAAGVPNAGSEGVGCGICHGIVHAEEPFGNGRYEVRGEPAFEVIGGWASTAYMLVKQDVEAHAAAWSPAALESREACAACHELQLNGLELRRTWSEWEEAGAEEPCGSCHAPVVAERFGDQRPLIDHRFRSGNVGLAGLDATQTEERRAFLAEAVTLSAERAGEQLVVSLENSGSGHGFPAGPLDLLVYGLEGRVGERWVALVPDLFGEELLDEEGRPITGHAIWRAHARRGPERIQPGRTRSWTLSAAEVEAVRLTHRRLREELVTRELADRMLDEVVIHEVPVDG